MDYLKPTKYGKQTKISNLTEKYQIFWKMEHNEKTKVFKKKKSNLCNPIHEEHNQPKNYVESRIK